MQLPVINEPERRAPAEELRYRALQIRGKLRRFIRSNVYTEKNEELLARRRGECTRCGACCKILLKCPFLDEANGEYSCSIYGQHFAQCQIFPLVPQDLKEIGEECGYYFEPQ